MSSVYLTTFVFRGLMGFWCVFVRWFVCRFDRGLVCVFLEMMGFCNLYFGDENGEQWRGERPGRGFG